MTQKDQILAHLKRHGSITTMTAYSRYGITCCGQRVTDLKRDGHDIRTTFGNGPHAIWVLVAKK